MPKFPGPVKHNNPDEAILDLTKRQVIGIGIFNNNDSGEVRRDNLHSNLRAKGYIATLTDTSASYVYTGNTIIDDDWRDSNNWAAIGGSSLPSGGFEDDILTKTSGDNAAWKPTLNTTALKVKNHGDSPISSEIMFSRKVTGEATAPLDILGEVLAEGFDIYGTIRTGKPSIRFVAGSGVGPTDNRQKSYIEFRVSDDGGTKKAFEISSDRKIVLSQLTDNEIPTAELGGLYYNTTQNSYYVAKST